MATLIFPRICGLLNPLLLFLKARAKKRKTCLCNAYLIPFSTEYFNHFFQFISFFLLHFSRTLSVITSNLFTYVYFIILIYFIILKYILIRVNILINSELNSSHEDISNYHYFFMFYSLF